ncbi:hypothetical protein Hypma_013292 [Hypsizygus marmoreus]|uniref:Uncharacterized protein n=1 Tax=Hypsizygus marmoreus TaxID=39966 RepID=A0A369JGR5_HYPMA|nr:hypothetical protein Hypma_013292 [Hypsizygus marmoreus]
MRTSSPSLERSPAALPMIPMIPKITSNGHNTPQDDSRSSSNQQDRLCVAIRLQSKRARWRRISNRARLVYMDQLEWLGSKESKNDCAQDSSTPSLIVFAIPGVGGLAQGKSDWARSWQSNSLRCTDNATHQGKLGRSRAIAGREGRGGQRTVRLLPHVLGHTLTIILIPADVDSLNACGQNRMNKEGRGERMRRVHRRRRTFVRVVVLSSRSDTTRLRHANPKPHNQSRHPRSNDTTLTPGTAQSLPTTTTAPRITAPPSRMRTSDGRERQEGRKPEQQQACTTPGERARRGRDEKGGRSGCSTALVTSDDDERRSSSSQLVSTL